MKIALIANDKDNVATVFETNVEQGEEIEVRDRRGNGSVLLLKDCIPYGHKVAVKPITMGSTIIKYGEDIGRATKSIEKGEHVHVHNLESMRGRGDLDLHE